MTTKSPDTWANLHISPDAGVPIWMQIRTQFEYLIATGAVPDGTRLPSVRQLARDLGVAVDTVRQAYDELTRAHLVTVRRGQGTFAQLPQLDSMESEQFLESAADAAIAAFVTAGEDSTGRSRILGQRLHLLTQGLNVAFVGVSVSVERYATELATEAGVPVHPVPIEDLRGGAVGLNDFSHIVTLVFHSGELNQLNPHAVHLSLMSRLRPDVLDAIDALPRGAVALLAREDTAPIYRDMITARRDDLEVIPVSPDQDLPPAVTALLHTTALAPNATSPTELPHIELRHGANPESLDQVAARLVRDSEGLHRLRASISTQLTDST